MNDKVIDEVREVIRGNEELIENLDCVRYPTHEEDWFSTMSGFMVDYENDAGFRGTMVDLASYALKAIELHDQGLIPKEIPDNYFD